MRRWTGSRSTSTELFVNRSEPRRDTPLIEPLPFVEPPPLSEEQKKEAFGDAPDAGLLLAKRREAAKEHVSQIGEATLRNVARLVERDLDDLPSSASAARRWLGEHAATLRGGTS